MLVFVNKNDFLIPLNSDEKSSRGTNWPKLNPANLSSIVDFTVSVNGDVETPALKGIPCTVNTSPFLYENPLLVILKSIIDPLEPTLASSLNPFPDPPVVDRFVYPVAIPTFITGGNCDEYPAPPLVTFIPVIIPALLPVPTVATKSATDFLVNLSFPDPCDVKLIAVPEFALDKFVASLNAFADVLITKYLTLLVNPAISVCPSNV